MASNSAKKLRGFDAWSNRIDKIAKGIPDDERYDQGLETIIDELEKGDYTSLGSELKAKIEERERLEKQSRNEKQKDV